MFIILVHWRCLVRVRALLAQRKRTKSEIHQVHDGPSFNSRLRIKKRRPHGHRYGKKPGDKEYYIANQLKKKCKKKFFQGIHDRFIRGEKFRNQMIESGRNEDLCRQMDALADEDHTHHLTPQEISITKNNWWLRSNKTGSDTVPVQRRPDFKQALSTLQQFKKKERSSAKPTRCTKFFFFFMVELARFLVDSLFL